VRKNQGGRKSHKRIQDSTTSYKFRMAGLLSLRKNLFYSSRELEIGNKGGGGGGGVGVGKEKFEAGAGKGGATPHVGRPYLRKQCVP